MFDDKSYSLKMDKTIEVFTKELTSLRTGRANANMLDLIKVDVYGQNMPIDQLATISAPEARLISIQVWDKGNVSVIDSAIQKSELGINPQIDGQIIRLRIPDLTEERRKNLNARETINTLLESGVIPIINENDSVATEELKFGDNDRLAARVAQMSSSDLLILLSDIDGLYDQNPHHSKTAKHIPLVTEINEEIKVQ